MCLVKGHILLSLKALYMPKKNNKPNDNALENKIKKDKNIY
jgi:hypothetical protein